MSQRTIVIYRFFLGKTVNGGDKKNYDNVIVNVGSVNALTNAVNLAWEDIDVFVNRGQGSCLKSCGRNPVEGDLLHILKKGKLTSLSKVEIFGGIKCFIS